MNKKFFLTLLFYALSITIAVNAEEIITKEPQSLLEVEKCKNLQAKLSGKNLDPQRVAAFVSSFFLDMIVNKKLCNFTKSYFHTEEELTQYNENNNKHFTALKEIAKNAWGSPGKSGTELVQLTPQILKNNSYELKNLLGLRLSVAILMHKTLLKKYKVHAFTSFVMSTNPLGLILYVLCNHYFLGKALIKMLSNYHSDEIPLCVKPEFDAAAQLWKINHGMKTIEFHQYAMIALTIFDKLEKEIAKPL